MNPRNLILAISLGAAMAAGLWAAMNLQQTRSQPTTATVLPARPEIAAFSLLDHEARPINENAFKGQWDLVFFGFTNCPDICPLTLQILSTAKSQLRESGLEPLPRIVFVSVDPARDTVDKMAAYVNAFGDGNLGVTGEIDELRKLTSGLGIYFEKHGSDDENYTVDHSAVVIVIDPDGRFHSLFGAPHAIENFVHDLPLLMTS
jgi:protein SCO1/2